MMQEMLPELSPTGETMVCESLVGLGKRALYTTDGDVPDTSKMERLLDILHSELPVCRSASDVRRLGNFEVLTSPQRIEETIFKLLDAWMRKRQRDNSR